MADIKENIDIKSETSSGAGDVENNPDIEERKKIIEEFSIGSNASQEVEKPATSEKKFPGVMLDDEDYFEYKDASTSGGVNFIVLSMIVLVIGLIVVWFVFLEDKVVSYANLPSKPMVIDEEIKTPFLSVDTLDPDDRKISSLNKEVESLSSNVQGYTRQIAKLEDSLASYSRKINILEKEKQALANKNRFLEMEIAPKKKSFKASEGNISKVWKIDSVQGGGQIVNVNMVGTDRIVSVSIGDSLVDVGLITSIRKTEGKWLVVGTSKMVSE